MITFEERNDNPKNKKTGDCAVRAITTALDKPYYEVYEDLYKLSTKLGFVFNDKRTIEKYLEQNGFVKMKQPRKRDNTKYLVKEIYKLIDVDDVVIVSLANHLTCIKNYKIIDLWNCGYKTISNYYILRK